MTARIFRTLLSVVFLAFVFLGCQDEEETILPPQEPGTADKDTVPVVEDAKVAYDLQGYVQKGPFINGTAITVSELDSMLAATGKNFTTQITDNRGAFAIKDIELQSDYVQLMANGFYFDEVQGEKSTAQLTLFALANLADTSSVVNVNLLSHLEKDRVIYLIQEEDKSFATAKKQAQREILAVFGVEKADIAISEKLNIAHAGEDNAILLAISVILQGYDGNVGNLSELLANISRDLKTDGILSDSTLGSSLINNAAYLDLAAIRKNVIDRYQELGHDVVIGDFEKYVQQFVTDTKFSITRKVEYPTEGLYGENILAEVHTSFRSIGDYPNWKYYSLSANVPGGIAMKIILRGGLWYYSAAPAPINWLLSTYDEREKSQEFIIINPGEINDIKIHFPDYRQTITIEYYEANATVPTKTRQITIVP